VYEAEVALSSLPFELDYSLLLAAGFPLIFPLPWRERVRVRGNKKPGSILIPRSLLQGLQ
jgi:hypothetical protein